MPIVDKPWGNENIFTSSDLPYTGKIITINQGHRWSLQKHDQKIETFCCTSGQAKLITGPTLDQLSEEIMEIGRGYTIQIGQIHRVEAITTCTIFEVSIPEVGTTYRYEDDYKRGDETPEVRSSPNRGWQRQ